MDGTLHRQVLDTGLVPPADRFGMWLDMITSSPAPLRVRTDHAEDFVARAEFIELGPIRLVNYRYPSVECVRTRKLVQRSDPDYYLLALTTSGRGVTAQDGQRSALGAYEFTFYDCSRPHEVNHYGDDHGREAASSVVAFIPYDALPLPPGRLAPLFAGRMSGTDGIGALVAQYLTQITDHPDQYHAADAGRLAGVGLDLISTMLGRHLVSEDAVPTEVRRRALLSQVRSFIRQHLGEVTLTPRQVAEAHHVSVRSLHRVFEAEETTVAAYIRDLRLEHCRRDLADPALRDRPIQLIAARWGFRDKAHFSRAFRAAHGLTPQEYRARELEQARIVNTAASLVNSEPTY
ncbi:helix-turn-helix domain-containing protein [Micromonospora sp. R77]|uniref:helix-turn-helix domain-containing protein n=1 Tax=Micromonospora sp. R77 TaxID=2925836 RepID=UPI001F623D65|nr:helix-turn-helix domain-containing protein [Micromonospora sp. R77]MCI4065352.1 helix-turn-helix domain-containing protein [Micromonospora sp. R77]